MGRIELTKVKDAPLFRKIALGSWNTVGDPSVYGLLEVEMSQALKFMAEQEQRHGVKLSPAHLVGKAVAHVLKSRPEINSLIRFGRIYQRKHVDLFYQVNIPAGEDGVSKATLAGTVVRQAENLSVVEIASALKDQAARVRAHQDPDMKAALGTAARMPWRLMKLMLNIGSFFNYDLNWNMTWAGLPRDPFGSVMITNVGSMGVAEAWAPLVPYTRVPLLLTVGAIHPRPWVVGDKVEPRPVMKIGVTFDHRLIDGVHAAVMSKHFYDCFNDPWKHLS